MSPGVLHEVHGQNDRGARTGLFQEWMSCVQEAVLLLREVPELHAQGSGLGELSRVVPLLQEVSHNEEGYQEGGCRVVLLRVEQLHLQRGLLSRFFAIAECSARAAFSSGAARPAGAANAARGSATARAVGADHQAVFSASTPHASPRVPAAGGAHRHPAEHPRAADEAPPHPAGGRRDGLPRGTAARAVAAVVLHAFHVPVGVAAAVHAAHRVGGAHGVPAAVAADDDALLAEPHPVGGGASRPGVPVLPHQSRVAGVPRRVPLGPDHGTAAARAGLREGDERERIQHVLHAAADPAAAPLREQLVAGAAAQAAVVAHVGRGGAVGGGANGLDQPVGRDGAVGGADGDAADGAAVGGVLRRRQRGQHAERASSCECECGIRSGVEARSVDGERYGSRAVCERRRVAVGELFAQYPRL